MLYLCVLIGGTCSPCTNSQLIISKPFSSFFSSHFTLFFICLLPSPNVVLNSSHLIFLSIIKLKASLFSPLHFDKPLLSLSLSLSLSTTGSLFSHPPTTTIGPPPAPARVSFNQLEVYSPSPSINLLFCLANLCIF